jgi:hypothetical protein
MFGYSRGEAAAASEASGEGSPKFERGRQSEAALFQSVAADPVAQRAFLEAMQRLLLFSRLREPGRCERIEAVSARAVA